jgi:GST-like protein
MDPPQILPYAQNRYRAETKRLYTLLDKQLAVSEFVAGDFFSIADMAIWSWASLWRRQEQTLDDKPNFSRWLEIVKQRPGVQAGRALEAARRTTQLEEDREAQKLLFRQT